ncbi:MAG: protein translocase subunit SecD [Acidimicrobiales bacterium]
MGSAKLSALLVVGVTVLAAIYTVLSGNQPLLGLDLQGGVSVVLQPTGSIDPDTGEPVVIDEEALDQTVEIIRSRVDALGVAEPEISRQGETIVVDLPGVKEQQRALELVGQTAELRFRPVIFDLGPELDFEAVESGTEDDEAPADDGDSEDDEESQGGITPIAFSTTTADDVTEDDGATTSTTTADDGGDDDTTTDDTAEDGDTIVPPANQSTIDPAELAVIEACGISGVTEPELDFAASPVVLADETGNRLCLGPTLLTGDSLETAGVDIDATGNWTVNPVFRSGPEGIDAFNEAAALCYVQSPDPIVCPSGRLAIVLDHVVVSSPTINAPTFGRNQIVISGSFEEEGARDLASVLRFGALPIELETQQTRTVSATIGDDVLRAGVIAGLIGLAMVAVYLLAYYRLAGLVALAGLVISAVLLWAIISWFGENLGLALTLAGVVGLIVSVGVSADSNIVYFENVKDAYRGGRRVPTAVDRAYQSAISTIVKADVVSLIAAALLYWLTVGAVRGFAFYLGLATILDLLISWLFMRPALAFIARRKAVAENPALLGLPARPEPVTSGRPA